MRAAIAAISLAACAAAPPPREPAPPPPPPPPAAEAAPVVAPPAGWIAFEHELWWGYVPSEVELMERRDATPAVLREVIAKGVLPEGLWLVGAYDFEPGGIAALDPYALIEASRDGMLYRTGMSLDAEQRASLATASGACPAVHFRGHNDDRAAAVTMFLCGARMVHVAWVATEALTPDELDVRRDRLLANIHLRD